MSAGMRMRGNEECATYRPSVSQQDGRASRVLAQERGDVVDLGVQHDPAGLGAGVPCDFGAVQHVGCEGVDLADGQRGQDVRRGRLSQRQLVWTQPRRSAAENLGSLQTNDGEGSCTNERMRGPSEESQMWRHPGVTPHRRLRQGSSVGEGRHRHFVTTSSRGIGNRG
ncbi:hypothetical protein VTK73DRAFT_3590 [Phialemonium thermophilum]|uniref:Uncharacterized protein n=1 Tax=Phialemonium thermophilum TaxID=223376 RepID=A0ABR3VGW1_9PEZI